MAQNTENYVTHNPFEGDNGAMQGNQVIPAGIGFTVSFVFFTLMFIIATIIAAV